MLDTAMYGSAGPDMAGLAFWAGAIGAVYGAAGGLMAGLICAGIASAVSRRQVLTRQFCRRLASGVCVAVAGGIGSWMGLWAYQENPVLDTLTWFVVPVLVATAVANLVGGWVWARTWEGHRLIDDGS
jgi:hypothetical protein